MDIECRGCYYTVCSFICLTEDLSEILQFLWRHGCLRKSYSCEKCGKKCAIGDKDLFFRCNRNCIERPPREESPKNDMQIQHMPSFSNNLGLLHPLTQQYVICELLPGNPHMEGPHPALRGILPLPGDPLPPSHPAPVLQGQYNLTPMSFEQRQTSLIHSQVGVGRCDALQLNHSITEVVNMDKMQESELADLDETTSRKRPLNGSTNSKKRCNFKVSMKKGTFFEKSKLPIDTVCKFVGFWCCMKHPTQEFLRNELSLATRTVVDWSTTCRNICVHWAKTNSEKIGGDGVMVQVDEVKIASSKTTEEGGNRFSFWGMEKDREKGRIFIVPMPSCDAWSLLTIINDWILPGSIIVSNCWKGYDCLKYPEYVQQTVSHNKTFIHPPNNAGQSYYEVKNEESNTGNGSVGNPIATEMPLPRFGTRRSHHLGDLAEFMFKRRFSNHLERMHAFFKQIALAYPLR